MNYVVLEAIYMSERLLSYNPPISTELRDAHEQALSAELRWQRGMQFSDVEETVLDHVSSLLSLHDENEIIRPALFEEVDAPETKPMIYIHDTGELGGFDLSHSVPNYEAERARVKRQEAVNFRFITKKYISDIELKAYVRSLYGRYEHPLPDDAVAQYVHLIDKIQATKFGAVNVFPARKLTRQAERLQQVNHVYGITIGFAQNLARLVSPDAAEDVRDLVDKSLVCLIENGYRVDEVNPYREQARNSI